MKVLLPRNYEVDLDNIPEDFEEHIQKLFSEYTEMTNPCFMYHDKLCFIDGLAVCCRLLWNDFQQCHRA